MRWISPDPDAEGKLYVSIEAGAVVKSPDGGETWSRPDRGLSHHYLWGLAVDPADPETILVSAARGAGAAHNPSAAESAVYRKTAGESWRRAEEGLPEGRGTLVPILATNPAEPGAFYALSNKGVHRSTDAGLSWEALSLPWRRSYLGQRHQALLIAEP